MYHAQAEGFVSGTLLQLSDCTVVIAHLIVHFSDKV